MYERLPAFCDSCKIVGHTSTNCRFGRQEDGKLKGKRVDLKGKAHSVPKPRVGEDAINVDTLAMFLVTRQRIRSRL